MTRHREYCSYGAHQALMTNEDVLFPWSTGMMRSRGICKACQEVAERVRRRRQTRFRKTRTAKAKRAAA